MESHSNILLYSKFSHACKDIVGLIDKIPELKQTTNFLCIDNQEIRQRVLTNQKIPVKIVPAIIRIYENTGYTELFEGDTAFSLVNAYLQQNIQQKPLVTSFEPEEYTNFSEIQPNLENKSQTLQKTIPQGMTPKPQKVSAIPQNISPPMKTNEPEMHRLRQIENTKKSVTFSSATAIEDLEDLEDLEKDNKSEDVAVSTYLHIPRDQEVLDIQASTRTPPERALKKNDSEGSVVNLVAKALQMQKEREKEVPNSNNTGNNFK